MLTFLYSFVNVFVEELLKLLEDYIIFKLDEKGNILYSNSKKFAGFIEQPFIDIVSDEDKKKIAKMFLKAFKEGFAEGKIRTRFNERYKILSIKIAKREENFYVVGKEIREEAPSFICDFLGNVIYAADEWEDLLETNIFDKVENKEKLFDIIEKSIEEGEYEGNIYINEREAKVRIKAHQHLEFFIEEDLCRTIEEIFEGKDINDIFEKANKVLQTLNINYFFTLFDRKFGEKREEEKFRFYIWLDGKEIGRILVYDDVDEYVRQIIKLLAISTSKAVKFLEDFTPILRNFAIYKINMEGKILYVNEEFSRLIGYDAREIIGKNIRDIAEKREDFFEKINRGKVENFISNWNAKDRVIVVSENAWKLNEQIISIIRDITSEREKERENEFYNSLLRHDIYNKNEIAIGYLYLLEKTRLTKKQREYVKKIEKAIREANKLIENVRKAEELRRSENVLISINIKEIIEKVCESFKESLDEKDIKLNLDVEDAFIVGDEFIGEIFINLIRNAIEHSNCKNINIEGKRKENKYVISVEDDGKGIEKEYIDRIFERGWKKDSGGSGLGLYIVKKLVEKYNGKIEVDSEIGKGTKFVLYFNIPRKKVKTSFLKIRF